MRLCQTTARWIGRPVALPHDRRLTLVGDPDRRDVLRGEARCGDRLAPDGHRRGEDLLGVVLDVAGRGVVLRDLAVRASEHSRLVVEHERRRPRGALIQRKDRRHGLLVLKRRMGSISAR